MSILRAPVRHPAKSPQSETGLTHCPPQPRHDPEEFHADDTHDHEA
jgi:hypothetical protein